MAKYNIRKANRSGTQKCEVCGETHRLVRHHLRGRDILNWDSDWNACWICDCCHTKAHYADIIIEGWFQTTEGRELIWRLPHEPSITGQECKPPLFN